MWFLDSEALCGGVPIPTALTGIVSTIVTLIKIVVPIILVILGMIDMAKAVASQKDDEIKKGQKTLLSRCIAAGIVFFVVAIVQLLVSIVSKTGDSTKDNEWNSCICHFVGSCAQGNGING